MKQRQDPTADRPTPQQGPPPTLEDRVGQAAKQSHERAMVDMVRGQYEQRRRQRLPLELQWQLNLNFLLGNQYCDIDLNGSRIVEYDKKYDWQQREVFNHLAPLIEARMAKLSVSRPTMSVRPASDDSDDVAAARVCGSLLGAVSNKLNLPDALRQAMHWSEVCGSVFYKNVWDATRGRLIGRVDDQEVHEGELCIQVCPPFEIFPDRLDAADINDCRSILHARVCDPDEIYRRYGQRIAAEQVDTMAPGANLLLGGWGYQAHAASVLPQQRTSGVLLLEWYERPTAEHPQGRLLIVAGNTLLHEGPLAYHVDEDGAPGLPFVRQVALQVPGCFFGVSVIERCIPIQRAYNAVKNRKHEFINRLAMGVLAVEDGVVDCDQLQEEGLSPGQVLVYRQGGAPPTMLSAGVVPPELTYEEDRLRNEFMVISGVSDMSWYGGVSSNITSGVALDILREQDESRLSVSAESIRMAIELIARQWLRLYRQYAKGGRMDRIAGENGRIYLLDWHASDLTSDDVVCDSASELGQSLAQRRQMVTQLMQMGLLNDPQTGKIDAVARRKILDMLEFGRWEMADGLQSLHAARAELENRQLTTQNKAVEVDEYDDHQQHLNDHLRCYLSLLNNPGGKQFARNCQNLRQHIAAHRTAMQQPAAQPDALQALMQQTDLPPQ